MNGDGDGLNHGRVREGHVIGQAIGDARGHGDKLGKRAHAAERRSGDANHFAVVAEIRPAPRRQKKHLPQ